MATAGISGIIDFYTMQIDELTGELSGYSIDLVQAGRTATSLATQTSDKKVAIKEAYENDEGEIDEYDREDYQDEIDTIQEEYELKLAVINNWETELQNKQDRVETELQEATSFRSSYESALKQNISVDFKFAEGSK